MICFERVEEKKRRVKNSSSKKKKNGKRMQRSKGTERKKSNWNIVRSSNISVPANVNGLSLPVDKTTFPTELLESSANMQFIRAINKA